MAKTKYSWRQGSKIGIDPGEAGKALTDLYKKEGRLTPDSVVEEAQDSDSPLHAYFEWDDSAAAHEWRRVQARNVINSIRIIKTDDLTPRIMHVSIKNAEGGYEYHQASVIVKDESMWTQVMGEAKKELTSVERRMAGLAAIEAGTKKKTAQTIRKAVVKVREAVEAA